MTAGMTEVEPGVPAASAAPASREIALVDLLDRLLAGGVVITGDITLSIADVDLVRISLNAVITSVEAAVSASIGSGPADTGPIGTASIGSGRRSEP
jgi:Gas vesicle protein